MIFSPDLYKYKDNPVKFSGLNAFQCTIRGSEQQIHLDKGFISCLYRILHQLLEEISCSDNWDQADGGTARRPHNSPIYNKDGRWLIFLAEEQLRVGLQPFQACFF